MKKLARISFITFLVLSTMHIPLSAEVMSVTSQPAYQWELQQKLAIAQVEAIAERINEKRLTPFPDLSSMATSSLLSNKTQIPGSFYNSLQLMTANPIPGTIASGVIATLPLLSETGFVKLRSQIPEYRPELTGQEMFNLVTASFVASNNDLIPSAVPLVQRMQALPTQIERGAFAFDPQGNPQFISDRVAAGVLHLVRNMANPNMQLDSKQLHLNADTPSELMTYAKNRLQRALTQESGERLNSFLDQANVKGQTALLKHLQFRMADLLPQDMQNRMIPSLLVSGVVAQPRENFYQDFHSIINHVSTYIQNNPATDPLRDPASFLTGIRSMMTFPDRSSAVTPIENSQGMPNFQR